MDGLPEDLRAFLGDTHQVWQIGDGPDDFAKLYPAADAPSLKISLKGPNELSECWGVDLICEFGQSEPASGALMWFPEYNEYGYWAERQQRAWLFPGVNLDEILEHPASFLRRNALRDPRTFPCLMKPWVEEFREDERCTALIARARSLSDDSTQFPRALRAILLASHPDFSRSEKIERAIKYLAHQLIRVARDRDDVLPLCDRLLLSISMPVEFAAALENEAARFECNSGDDAASIRRLERIMANPFYAEYHPRFEKILAHVRNLPPV